MGSRLGDFPGRKRRSLLPSYRPSSRVALGRLVGMARVSGLRVAPEPPASHFTVADLTIRDVLVILKYAGLGALTAGIAAGFIYLFGYLFEFGVESVEVDGFWASLPPAARAVVVVVAVILMPGLVASVLVWVGKFLTAFAGSLERSRLWQRILVGLMALAVMGAWALTPYVAIPLFGAFYGAGWAYGDMRSFWPSRRTPRRGSGVVGRAG